MKRTRLTGLLAAIEDVYGTEVVPDPATDGIQLEEHIWNSIDVDYLERNTRDTASGNRMGRNVGGQPSGRFAKLTAVVAMRGSGVAYADAARPEIDVLLRAAGLQGVVSPAASTESVTYTPVDEDQESATVYAYSAGTLYKLVGCRARITSISGPAAQFGRATFEVWGQLLEDPTDVPLPQITYPAKGVKPPVLQSAALTLDTFGPEFRSFSFEQNLELTPRPRGNAPNGHAGYAITDYDPQLKAQIDSPDKAVFDPWTLERAATEFTWSFAVGATQYNRWKIEGGNGQIIRVPPEEDSGFAMLGLNIRCLHGAVNPAFSLVFD
ncbi:MAG TPA: phage tail tube protein [Longimicrobiaceae bacterium]|nr:phage tail tube protein [Longimicrobiaceae bacterium]